MERKKGSHIIDSSCHNPVLDLTFCHVYIGSYLKELFLAHINSVFLIQSGKSHRSVLCILTVLVYY